MFYWVTPTKSSKVEDNDSYKIFGKGESILLRTGFWEMWDPIQPSSNHTVIIFDNRRIGKLQLEQIGFQ